MMYSSRSRRSALGSMPTRDVGFSKLSAQVLMCGSAMAGSPSTWNAFSAMARALRKSAFASLRHSKSYPRYAALLRAAPSTGPSFVSSHGSLQQKRRASGSLPLEDSRRATPSGSFLGINLAIGRAMRAFP